MEKHYVPVISVIIPAYNSDKTIKSTVESVLNQTFSNFELIIINDGSQDTTLNIISQFNDQRIRLFSFDHAGGNISRNRGLKYAVGEFVSFLDADDIWTDDKLAVQLQALHQNPQVAVAYSWTDYIDKDAKFIFTGRRINVNGDVYENLLISNFLENGSNPLIRKKAILTLDGFDESLNAGQDWDMWLRLAYEFEFICVPLVQILYRISDNSVSSNLVRQEKACLEILERAYQRRLSLLNLNWNTSLANLYKYLTCKALQKPFSRPRALIAAKFLWKYFLYDSSRFQRTTFNLKLLLKITVILMLPTLLYTMTNQHKSKNQQTETIPNIKLAENTAKNKNSYSTAFTIFS